MSTSHGGGTSRSQITRRLHVVCRAADTVTDQWQKCHDSWTTRMRLWDNLSVELWQQNTSFEQFKQLVKTFLFDCVFFISPFLSSPTYLLTRLLTYLLIYVLTYLLTHLLTYLVTYLLTFFLTYLLTQLLTYLLTYLHTYWLPCFLAYHCDRHFCLIVPFSLNFTLYEYTSLLMY